MKVVYVAGTYRHSHAYKVWENINKARELAIKVWQHGAVALCPHMNSMFFEGAATPDQFIEGTLELMRRCDCVLVVPGSEKSIGTQGEIREARRLRKPVYFYDESGNNLNGSLSRWLEELDGTRILARKSSPHGQVPRMQRSVRARGRRVLPKVSRNRRP